MLGDPEPAVGQIWDTNSTRLNNTSQVLRSIIMINDNRISWSKINNYQEIDLNCWDFTDIKDSKHYKYISGPMIFRPYKSRFQLLLNNDRQET